MDTPYPVNTPRVGGFCGSTPTSEAYILSGLRMGHGWCGQTITTIQKPYSIYFINFAFGIHPPPKDGGILPDLSVIKLFQQVVSDIVAVKCTVLIFYPVGFRVLKFLLVEFSYFNFNVVDG